MNRATVVVAMTAVALAGLVVAHGPRRTLARDDRAGAGDAARAPLGINLAAVSHSSAEFPFVDVFRASKPFVFQRKGSREGVGDRHELRPDGYPTRLLPEHFAESLVCVAGGHYPGGEYVCLYDGRGRLEFAGDAVAYREEAGRVSLRVAPKDHVAVRVVETDPEHPLHNVRLMRAGFERTYRAEPFDPAFLKRWAGMGVVRFADWQRTNGSPVREWADRATPAEATWDTPRGVPVEVMVDLANRMQADPWFCVPHLANDEFVRQFAELVKAKLDPRLRAHVEYSAGCWDAALVQGRYCGDKGRSLSLAEDRFQAQLRFYARRSVEVFGVWERVFGREADRRVVRVLSSQAADPRVSEQILSWRDAARHADALAIAPYLGDAFGDPRRADATVQLTPEQVLERLHEELQASRERTVRHAQLAREHGLRLLAYEGGQHLAGFGGAEDNDALTRLFVATNRHRGMRALYRKGLENWRRDAGAAGGAFLLYNSVAAPGKWGSWGLLEHADQDPAAAPKYQAVQQFLSDHGR